jgi:hypothetical protein
VGRAAAVLTLAAALVAWYEIAPHVDEWSLWPSILLIAFVLMPATLLPLYLALPLSQHPHLIFWSIGFIGLAVLLWQLDWEIGANVCKVAGYALFGFWFLQLFAELSWVVLVAVLIPWVDAYSVWRGPTNQITEHHEEVFDAVSVAFVVPGGGAAQLGPPDVVFIAVFLAASMRFGLRPFWTWLGMTIGLGLTIICAVWWDLAGLPALPAISLGFLIPNADILWRRLRPPRAQPASDSQT